MTTPDEHQSFAAALEAKARVEMDADVIQQIAESWVDAIDDVHRLRELVKDKSRRLQSMVERLDEIKWHYDERDRLNREEVERLSSGNQALVRSVIYNANRSDKLQRRLATMAKLVRRQHEALAATLGMQLPVKRAWSTMLGVVRARLCPPNDQQ